LDPQVYTETQFKQDEIRSIVKHFAVASIGIKYLFIYENEEDVVEKEEFFYESYLDYFENEVRNTTTSDIFTLDTVAYEDSIQVITDSGRKSVTEKNKYNILISTNPEVFQETYLNMTYLSDG